MLSSVFIKKTNCIQIGEANIKGNDQIKRVYSTEGKSPCLSTCQGGNREPKIAVPGRKNSTIITNKIIQKVKVRKYSVDVDGLTSLLLFSKNKTKLTIKDISEKLNIKKQLLSIGFEMIIVLLYPKRKYGWI